MLVLTRKTGDSIVIDGHIRVTVTAVGPGRVRIGVDAPPHVRVDRDEVARRAADEHAEVELFPAEV